MLMALLLMMLLSMMKLLITTMIPVPSPRALITITIMPTARFVVIMRMPITSSHHHNRHHHHRPARPRQPRMTKAALPV